MRNERPDRAAVDAREPIRFTCPCCSATHTRGYLDGVSIFRCLRCGYVGHGLHPDPEIDRAVYEEWRDNNEWNRARGIPEVPLFEEHPNHG